MSVAKSPFATLQAYVDKGRPFLTDYELAWISLFMGEPISLEKLKAENDRISKIVDKYRRKNFEYYLLPSPDVPHILVKYEKLEVSSKECYVSSGMPFISGTSLELKDSIRTWSEYIREIAKNKELINIFYNGIIFWKDKIAKFTDKTDYSIKEVLDKNNSDLEPRIIVLGNQVIILSPNEKRRKTIRKVFLTKETTSEVDIFLVDNSNIDEVTIEFLDMINLSIY